ncbi:MAG: LLM class F420-dependent oxidoreductase [Acidimicrobiales bacterium]
MQRYGMSIPFGGVPLHAHREWICEVAELGYTDVWSSESDGADGFTPLALSAAWAPSLRLGVAIIPAFTRAPAVMAQSAAALARAAPGRFVMGLGASSNVIVERWNGVPFTHPYQRTRDMVRFLRAAFTGEKVSMACPSFTVDGFRLAIRPDPAPPILVAALRQGMLTLAGREGDGAIINWLTAADVAKVAPLVHAAGPGKEIVCRIFVAPTTDREAVLEFGRRQIAAYLNVGVYAEFHRWLGRGEELAPMWEAWAAGDRKAALAAIPETLVDELIVNGTPDECRAHIQRYVDNGVTTPALAVQPVRGLDLREAVRALAPA